MVGVFFYCNNVCMDIDKLFKKVIDSEEIQNIPFIFVVIVFNCVMESISSGECFYSTEID